MVETACELVGKVAYFWGGKSLVTGWDEALPGDLVFYSDVSHIGIVGGRDTDGNLLIIHCTRGSINGVTISGAGGFGIVVRPSYFTT